MIGLGEVCRGSEALPTGLLSPPEHLRGVHPLQDDRGLVVTTPRRSLNASDLAHDCLLFLALASLLGVHRFVPLLLVRVVLDYIPGLPLGETHLVIVLGGACHLLLLLEDNSSSRLA